MNSRLGRPTPIIEVADRTYKRALEEGWGREDKGAMVKVFEKEIGCEFSSTDKKLNEDE
tara:strand:- start:675 stop:851 length:177 start_codon:yes stop_codon:yes gene_type:complete